MRLLLGFAFVGAVLIACGPPCSQPAPMPITSSSVCVVADGGAFAPDAGFTLRVSTNGYPSSPCVVDLDVPSGRITLGLGHAVSTSCSDTSGAAAPREPPIALCHIPPLPGGQYTIDTQPPTVFTLPAGDAGLPACP